MKWLRRKPVPLGRRGEQIAARHLQFSGYRILDRNVKLGRYEVDIIVQKGDVIAFVEVKTRLGAPDPYVHPSENITPTKEDHLRRAADIFIAREKNPKMNYRFDIVSVVIPEKGKPTVEVYENAFS